VLLQLGQPVHPLLMRERREPVAIHTREPTNKVRQFRPETEQIP
jgi:hypothetical protein